ncbi:MAG: hypothetical protein H0T62_06665 [Parachlamydiaceae bacterium]|nr:hypothetical protein [Parachlamydiaceae bacterium]
MKIEKIDIPAAGTWARDCELLCLSQGKGFKIIYHRDDDDTYWIAKCQGVVAYKVIGEEFSTTGYLFDLPVDGAFFEILDSPWMREFGDEKDRILSKCKHYILEFYDETIEIITRDIVFEQLKEKPQISCLTS